MTESERIGDPAKPSYRVLIADQYRLVRCALRCALEIASEIAVIGEAEDGGEAATRIIQEQPDVALVSLVLPRLDAIEVVRRVAKSHEKLGYRVLILGSNEDGLHAREAYSSGAAGYFPTSSDCVELVNAIKSISAGHRYMHPRIASELFRTRSAIGSGKLSLRENEVLRLAAQGFSGKEIADRLLMSTKSVEAYKRTGFQKLGIVERTELVRFAAARGWLIA